MGEDDPGYRPMAWHLETERLILNPYDATDAELLAELISERGPGARGFGTTVQGARDNIANNAKDSAESGIGMLAVRRRTEGDFIGYCGLLVGRASLDAPEIAFELLGRAQGQGYATEAASAIIEAAKATGRQRLWSTVAAWNQPSLRVLEKTGFRRDHADQVDGLVYLFRDL